MEVNEEGKEKKRKKKTKKKGAPPHAPPPDGLPPPRVPQTTSKAKEDATDSFHWAVPQDATKEETLESDYHSGVLSDDFQAAEAARLEGHGMVWADWSAPVPAFLKDIRESQRDRTIPSAKKFLPLEWIVDLRASYMQETCGVNGQGTHEGSSWVIATAYSFDDEDGTLDIACPDRYRPSWRGRVPVFGDELRRPGANHIRLIESCDSCEDNPASWAIYTTLLRANVVHVDWLLEWAGNDSHDEKGKCVISGKGVWFSRLTNQLLCTTTKLSSPSLVNLTADEACVTIFGVGRSGEGAREFEALARQDVVHSASGYSNMLEPQRYGEDCWQHTTGCPRAVLRQQLELLMYYQNEMKCEMESSLELRDQAIRDQHEVMGQLQSFVFEGDLMNGHEVLDLLNRRAQINMVNHVNNLLLPHPGNLMHRMHDVEVKLWYAMERDMLRAVTQPLDFQNGAKVRVLFRAGGYWEPGIVEVPTQDHEPKLLSKSTQAPASNYDVRMCSDGALLEAVPAQYIELRGKTSTNKVPASSLSASSSAVKCEGRSVSATFKSKVVGRSLFSGSINVLGMTSKSTEWLASERARLQKELGRRRGQCADLVRIVNELNNSFAESRRRPRAYKNDFNDNSKTAAVDMSDADIGDAWWGGSGLPRQGEVVMVHFSNGWFWGRILRSRMRHESSRKPMTNEALAEGGGDDGGEDVWTFDVGFEGDYVEKGLPVGRLAAPKDLGFLGNVEDATNEGDDGTTRDPEEELREMKEGKNNIAVAAAKQLRVVACSLNMSGRSFLPAQGGADAFGKWIAPGGSFESAVLGSSEDTADIIVIALQDAPSEDMGHHGSFRPHKEKIAEQLGVFFHLTAVVQRHRGALQLLVFVRKALIPKEGTEVLSLKSFALGLKADGTFEKECPDGRSQLGGQPYVSTRRIDEACGGLTVQLNIAGTTFRFIACRLVHGQEASTTAIRRDQITKITEAVAKNFDGPIFDCAHHCFLLGDLGCRIDLRESTIGEQEHSALLLELARGGPSGWRRLYQV